AYDRGMSIRATLAVLAIAACGGQTSTPPSCEGRWQVCAGALRDPDGRTAILRGMNVSGGNKSAPYLDFHAEPDLVRMRRDWGMNAMRWVMPWAAVEPSEGVFDDAYLDQVALRLDWAQANGIAVVLDMHQDVFGEGFGFDGAPRWACDE